MATGLLAICIQHEIDHLDGKLFVDYLSELKRNRIRKKLEKDRRDRARARRSPLSAAAGGVLEGDAPHRLCGHARVLRAGARRAGTGAGFPIAAVYTRPDRPAGRGRELSASPVKLSCAPSSACTSSNRQTSTSRKHSRRSGLVRAPEVMVVVAYGLILPQAVLQRAAARLSQHPCFAAATLARRRADPARGRSPATARDGGSRSC